MNKIKLAIQYVKYYWSAQTLYNIHSPFAFELFETLLDKDRQFYDFEAIEKERNAFLGNQKQLLINDLGAGSHQGNEKTKRISSIASSALSPASQCQQLFRLIEKLKPKTLLEFGTSLGISTAYFARARKEMTIYTMEGSSEIRKEALGLFDRLQLQNVESRLGPFDEILDAVLQEAGPLDVVFLDGNHTYEATIRYYNAVKNKIHSKSLVIVDDIYWSAGMKKAWYEIMAKDEVTLSVDLFYYGLIFFDENIKEKKNLVIIPQRWKPFKFGFFR